MNRGLFNGANARLPLPLHFKRAVLTATGLEKLICLGCIVYQGSLRILRTQSGTTTELVLGTHYTTPTADRAYLLSAAAPGDIFTFEFWARAPQTPRVVLVPGSVATFDSTAKASTMTLSGGNLTVTNSNGVGGQWGNARATRGIDSTAANHYFEMVAGTLTSGYAMIGVCDTSHTFGTAHFVGDDTHSWGYFGNSGNRFYNSGGTAYGASYTAGDVIGVLVKNAKVYFRKNGAWQNSADPVAETGEAFSLPASTTIYPCGALYTNGDTITARFNAGSLSGSLPSGTQAWE